MLASMIASVLDFRIRGSFIIFVRSISMSMSVFVVFRSRRPGLGSENWLAVTWVSSASSLVRIYLIASSEAMIANELLG